MENYIGCKIIKAEPMSFLNFNRKFKSMTPSDSDLDDEGYHVQYPDGYNSWSPKDVFENAYRKITDSEIKIINQD